MLIWKFLHIVSMFGAVTLVLGGAIFLHLVARSQDLSAYRRLGAIVLRSDWAAGALLMAGIGFGILTAITGGFDQTARWLILAYLQVVAIIAVDFGFVAPRQKRLREAAAEPDPAVVGEFQRLVHARGHLVAWSSGRRSGSRSST
jgi:uncharacterized membrane protein SirB2